MIWSHTRNVKSTKEVIGLVFSIVYNSAKTFTLKVLSWKAKSKSTSRKVLSVSREVSYSLFYQEVVCIWLLNIKQPDIYKNEKKYTHYLLPFSVRPEAVYWNLWVNSLWMCLCRRLHNNFFSLLDFIDNTSRRLLTQYTHERFSLPFRCKGNLRTPLAFWVTKQIYKHFFALSFVLCCD